MSSESNVFTKDNLDMYLKALAKEFRRINGKSMPAEIILIGGAAILANYGFRDMTTDIDAVIHAASSMKDAINRVGDQYHLPNGWLNADFMKTASYSPKLDQFSVYYRTYSNVLRIRTMSSEYLVAMKLRSGRQYKNDMSDVIGILAEHERRGEPITMDAVNTAVQNLYGSWDGFPPASKAFIESAIAKGNFEEIYANTILSEKESKKDLIDFEEHYPGVTTEGNVQDILSTLKARRNKDRER